MYSARRKISSNLWYAEKFSFGLQFSIVFCIPQEYDIEIKRICNRDMTSNENFVIKITDSRLLENCGGIVQGMSGSPIVQNGKIIGAVTHVFLNNPKEGYGVFAQYMANRYNNQH